MFRSAVVFIGAALLLPACGAREDLTEPSFGLLEITVITGGAGSDADGYVVTLDGGEPLAIATSGTVRLPSVAVGDRTVMLGGVAESCTVANGTTRQVQVNLDALTRVEFEVSCALVPEPTMQVVVSTSGTHIDPDGYSVRVDPGQQATVTTDDEATFSLPSPGAYQVRLAGVAGNCTVNGENPREVTVPGQTTFAVACWPPVSGRIAFVSERTLSFEGQIVVRRADGVGLDTVVSQPGSYLRNPSWSPDGSRLVFERFSFDDDGACCVFLVNPDGNDVVPVLVPDAQFVPEYDYDGIYHPKWSPDGQQLLFVYAGSVFTVGIDRSGLSRIVSDTMGARSASWSSDGQRIVFGVRRSRPEGGGVEQFDQNLYVVNADGSGLAPLTGAPGTTFYRDPAWSPDGHSIAFASNREGGNPFDGDLFVLDLTTGTAVNLTHNLAEYASPAWSPDGSFLTFAVNENQSFAKAIWLMNSDGSHPRRLTSLRDHSEYAPAWGP